MFSPLEYRHDECEYMFVNTTDVAARAQPLTGGRS